MNTCSYVMVMEKLSLVKAMATVTQMKCACDACVCVVAIEDAIKKDGKNYCSDACASGHPNGENCGHQGCDC
jgi:metallothionein